MTSLIDASQRFSRKADLVPAKRLDTELQRGTDRPEEDPQRRAVAPVRPVRADRGQELAPDGDNNSPLTPSINKPGVGFI